MKKETDTISDNKKRRMLLAYRIGGTDSALQRGPMQRMINNVINDLGRSHLSLHKMTACLGNEWVVTVFFVPMAEGTEAGRALLK